MEKEDFLEEIKDNTLDELEFIYETQKDLYSQEEMEIIKDKIEDFKKKEIEKIEKMLPKEIECPKCFGPNEFKNESCTFCGAKLNKEKYYTLEYYNNYKENIEIEEKESYSFQYIISFLIPLGGFILGAIMMSKENDEKVSIGKKCVVVSITSIIIYVISIIVLFNF